MRPALTFTLDLEDHRPHDGVPLRYPAVTERLLGTLAEKGVKATVFTVGTLAQSNPDLIKSIHAAGHEIAHHSYDHTPITAQTREQFKVATQKAKNILEDITGEKVTGYRAPVFSLTRQTPWAADVLKELGFEYSSSILPAASPLHGFPGAPQRPFRWPNGLLEIPVPVAALGPVTLPYLGGFYFRYLPFAAITGFIKGASPQTALWTYCHPYDFDPGEKNWRIKGASVPVSLLLWFNRAGTFSKIDKLLSACDLLPPFRGQDFSHIAEIFDPSMQQPDTKTAQFAS